MTIFTLAQMKGGMGKSPHASGLTAYLSQLGRRALLVELDIQGHASFALGLTNLAALPATMADVIAGDLTMDQAAQPSPHFPGASVLAGTDRLTDAGPRDKIAPRIARIIAQQSSAWDDVVIDTPGSWGAFAVAGLIAADHVVVPCTPTMEGWSRLAALEDRIALDILQTGLRDALSIGSILPTKVRTRGSVVQAEFLARMRARYGDRVTPTTRASDLMSDALAYGLTVGQYRPKAPVAADLEAAYAYITTRQD